MQRRQDEPLCSDEKLSEVYGVDKLRDSLRRDGARRSCDETYVSSSWRSGKAMWQTRVTDVWKPAEEESKGHGKALAQGRPNPSFRIKKTETTSSAHAFRSITSSSWRISFQDVWHASDDSSSSRAESSHGAHKRGTHALETSNRNDTRSPPSTTSKQRQGSESNDISSDSILPPRAVKVGWDSTTKLTECAWDMFKHDLITTATGMEDSRKSEECVHARVDGSKSPGPRLQWTMKKNRPRSLTPTRGYSGYAAPTKSSLYRSSSLSALSEDVKDIMSPDRINIYSPHARASSLEPNPAFQRSRSSQGKKTEGKQFCVSVPKEKKRKKRRQKGRGQ